MVEVAAANDNIAIGGDAEMCPWVRAEVIFFPRLLRSQANEPSGVVEGAGAVLDVPVLPEEQLQRFESLAKLTSCLVSSSFFFATRFLTFSLCYLRRFQCINSLEKSSTG